VPDICKGLTGEGMPATTPVALIQQGTTVNQRVYLSTLERLPELVQTRDIKPPTLIIVGEVVRLHDKLRWFLPQTDVVS
jgi:uroporphyrin-III C-methyltransferase / precorrin-2 dehydrogenase / sirohydrochlorin ferrochelatase